MHVPRVVRLLGRKAESSRHATLSFRDPLLQTYAPGQFVMVWVPGVDEVPMALWGNGDPYKLTIEAKGDATRALCALSEGDTIGIRGPYGNGFTPKGDDLLFVAGGTGTVPLVEVARHATGEGAKVRVALGGRTHEYLLLADAFEDAGAEVHRATDDGSDGFHGRAPELAAVLLEERRPAHVLACGPERMMRAVFDIVQAAGIPFQASLERWMKCAVGICDACLVDGLRLCRDGPVLDAQTLARIDDFGSHERGPDGRRMPLH
jgi:dihydroorotate dehydrogenase electron transfer subunit